MIFSSLAVGPMLRQKDTVQTKRAMDHRRTGSVVKFFFDLFIRPESDQCLFCLPLSATNKLAKGRHTNSSLRTLS